VCENSVPIFPTLTGTLLYQLSVNVSDTLIIQENSLE
jgi:hypothetical protein